VLVSLFVNVMVIWAESNNSAPEVEGSL